jgi:hypothetical protein
MERPRQSLRHRWLPAMSLLAATLLTAMTTPAVPALADDFGAEVVREYSGTSDKIVSISYDRANALLLDHFFFRDVNADMHLHQIQVLPIFDLMFINFNDTLQNDVFEYRVAHSHVRPTGMISGHHESSVCYGKCIKNIAPPAGDYVFVLEGFDFEFPGDTIPPDRHIDEIGVVENSGVLTTYFNDQNDDDMFAVTVDYWWVPRSMLSNITSLSGSVDNAGSTTRNIPSGNKVIRGFHVDNLASGGAGDNHIKRFGFLTRSTTVDIYYGDQDPSDSADWSYLFRYAILR